MMSGLHALRRAYAEGGPVQGMAQPGVAQPGMAQPPMAAGMPAQNSMARPFHAPLAVPSYMAGRGQPNPQAPQRAPGPPMMEGMNSGDPFRFVTPMAAGMAQQPQRGPRPPIVQGGTDERSSSLVRSLSRTPEQLSQQHVFYDTMRQPGAAQNPMAGGQDFQKPSFYAPQGQFIDASGMPPGGDQQMAQNPFMAQPSMAQNPMVQQQRFGSAGQMAMPQQRGMAPGYGQGYGGVPPGYGQQQPFMDQGYGGPQQFMGGGYGGRGFGGPRQFMSGGFGGPRQFMGGGFGGRGFFGGPPQFMGGGRGFGGPRQFMGGYGGPQQFMGGQEASANQMGGLAMYGAYGSDYM